MDIFRTQMLANSLLTADLLFPGDGHQPVYCHRLGQDSVRSSGWHKPLIVGDHNTRGKQFQLRSAHPGFPLPLPTTFLPTKAADHQRLDRAKFGLQSKCR